MSKRIGSWIVDLHEDDDGHLTLGLNHDDGSKIVQVNEDVTANPTEWGDRFTTEQIEKDYGRTDERL